MLCDDERRMKPKVTMEERSCMETEYMYTGMYEVSRVDPHW
jgi:hypothetical protein